MKKEISTAKQEEPVEREYGAGFVLLVAFGWAIVALGVYYIALKHALATHGV